MSQNDTSQNGTRKGPLIVAAVIGLALILVVRNLIGGGHTTSANKPQSADGSCTVVAVTASSEKAALLKEMAGQYADSGPSVDGHCVEIQVTSKSSGGATEALARGWDEAVDGPRPDVWSPAAASWVVLLQQRLAARDAPNIVPADLPKIAASPLVIAMPRPMAEALGWPGHAVGWADILALSQDPAGWGKYHHPEWGKFRLGKTNPNFSTSGLNATIGAYFAATGRSNDLSLKDVQSPKVRAFVKGVESAVVHYGDITLTFLSNLQKADDAGAGLSYISAVTVEEKSVWDYNNGNPKGDPAELGKHAPPSIPLAAIYPKEGTLLSDHPYAVLNAPWVTDGKKHAAADFLKFLQAGAQQDRFKKAAFRDFSGKPGGEISQAKGMLPDQPTSVLAPPAPAVLDAIQRSWSELRKRARVLLVMDVSGSMGEAVPDAGATKLELAKSAATKALDLFDPSDDLGMWIFSTDLDGSKPYLQTVPIQPVRKGIRALKQSISSLIPDGGTGLYSTTRAAARAMRAGFDPTRINAVVVLTDGRNEYPADTDLNGLLRELRVEGDQDAVRIFPIAYGKDADLGPLTQMAEASRAAAYNASDPQSIDKVFTAVISNF